MSIIKAENLTFQYSAATKTENALQDLNLTIEKGSFTAIIGQNGSGKSTFAKHINAMLLPSGGSITVCGFDTREEKTLYELRKNAGMVFQNPDNQIVATIVEEDVAFGLENICTEYEEMHRRVKYALEAVGMYEYRKSAPHMLSGGQKQRVAIAGILAMKPQCIILDEPTAMLDPAGRKEVINTICTLNKENNITIILITHHMDEVVKADRVIVMNNGNIEMDAPPREVFKNSKRLKELGLEVPRSAELAHRLRESGIAVREDILSAEECAEEILKVAQHKSR